MAAPEEKIIALKQIAKQIRKDDVTMIAKAGSGHPGGSLSLVEILVTLFFGGFLRHDPKNPDYPDRDRLILSKGHGCPALYAALAHRGYFPREMLWTLRKLGSQLQGHPHRDPKHGLPGIETSSGSLGQGLSIANGMALAARLDKKSYRIYCITGDGEIEEGQIWEAAMTASHYKLDNLCAVVDANGVQQNGPVAMIKTLEPMASRWESFGWHAIELDGHRFSELFRGFEEAKNTKGKPTVLIARTVKGKGVSFMEGRSDWHGKAPNEEQLAQALREIEAGDIG
ncbi:MAG: transketolase [Candidatus Omnitrophota bacterium]